MIYVSDDNLWGFSSQFVCTSVICRILNPCLPSTVAEMGRKVLAALLKRRSFAIFSKQDPN